MHILGSAISLNVADPVASSSFLREHLGFVVEMEQDGFVSLAHPDGGSNIIFLRTGLSTFKPNHRAGDAGEGTLIVFVVDSVDEAYERLAGGGAKVVTQPETEPWGERYCQFEDPNGIIVQLVQWLS